MCNFEKNTIVYVTPGRNAIGPRKPMLLLFQYTFKGAEDISTHGSPMYEDFIVCIDPKTGEKHQFGSLGYNWCDAMGKIETLKNNLNKIHSIAACV